MAPLLIEVNKELIDFGRKLPMSVDAEMAVIGAALSYTKVEVGAGLEPIHFIVSEHQAIWAAILEARRAELVFDALKAEQYIVNDPRFSSIGGKKYLERLLQCADVPINAQEHARLIIDCYNKRELINIAENLSAAAYCSDVTETADVLISKHETELAVCKTGLIREANIPDPHDWAASSRRINVPIAEPKTYLGKLVYEGCRVMVSGGTGSGKTLLGMALASSLVNGDDFIGYKSTASTSPRVLYIDYELGRQEMRDRLKHHHHENLFVVCYDDAELGEDGLLPLDTNPGKEQIKGLIKSLKIDIVMIDNLYSAVEGSIVGGTEKNGAHDKFVPLVRQLSKDGIGTIVFHHSGHDKSREYGDARLTWQFTAHLHIEAFENAQEGETSVTVTVRKMRRAPIPQPITIVFDASTGRWMLTDITQRVVLSDRQQWLCMTATKLLETNGFYVETRDYPVAFVADLREAYRKHYFASDPHGSSERMGWSRDVKACVTYFGVEAMYFFKTLRT